MERASKLLLNSKLSSKASLEATVAKAAWKTAVGDRLGEVTYAASYEKGTLRIYVEDQVWQTQLTALKPQIVTRIRKVLGCDLVRDIELRIMPGRRGPMRETQVVRDGSDAIEDPILRRTFQRKQG